ncbi:HAD-IB family hydrolase [Nocardia brasiliensis]
MTRPSQHELTERLRAIRTGPHGPRVGAFFDFDGTVIDGFSHFHLLRARRRRKPAAKPTTSTLLAGLSGRKTYFGEPVPEVWRDYAERVLTAAETGLFTRSIAGRLFPQAWQLIRAHAAAGHTVVLATAAANFQVRTIAKEFGVTAVLCTNPAVAEGKLTGAVRGTVLSGTHKATAVTSFALDNGVALERSYGYSNGLGDLPLLSAVGIPTAVNPDRGLAAVAGQRNWQVLRFRRHPRFPGPYRIARTLLAVGAVAAAAAAAIMSTFSRGRQATVDRMYSWISTASLRCAGVRIRIAPSEHVGAHRPAVFIFNHQSQIDALIVPYVLRGGFVPLVTAKARRYPVFGPLLRFIGVTFVGQSSPRETRGALDALVPALAAGTSVAIAPEGRVSPTPQLLPFKKGAFHLAAKAGVPIVPIVIRNSGQTLWRSHLFVRPGTVDVTVLEPIDVSTWEPHSFDENIENVRRLYLHTLTYEHGYTTRVVHAHSPSDSHV